MSFPVHSSLYYEHTSIRIDRSSFLAIFSKVMSELNPNDSC